MGKLLNALREWTEERFNAIEKRIKEFELKRRYSEEKNMEISSRLISVLGWYAPSSVTFAGRVTSIFSSE